MWFNPDWVLIRISVYLFGGVDDAIEEPPLLAVWKFGFVFQNVLQVPTQLGRREGVQKYKK